MLHIHKFAELLLGGMVSEFDKQLSEISFQL